MAETRFYPMNCRSLHCGEVSCPATCPNLPELQAFKAWRERTGAVKADHIWSPNCYKATI
jgi:hypothetical protein